MFEVFIRGLFLLWEGVLFDEVFVFVEELYLELFWWCIDFFDLLEVLFFYINKFKILLELIWFLVNICVF